MKFTGERVIPGQGDVDLFNEHRARYRFAQRYSSGKTVLDAACGSGYGSALLGENAKAVWGVDISLEAVEYARRSYGSAKVRFTQCDCLALPFPSGRFDLVAAFEIIEHMEDPQAFLQELLRVLTPSGLLILSTPNRLYYTQERGETNPFHHREFSFPELEEILQPLFPHRAILLENHVPGLLLSAPGAEPNFRSSSAEGIPPEAAVIAEAGEKQNREEKEKAAHYFVALCSRQPLGPVSPLLYLPSAGNVLREREIHIRLLSGYLEEAKAETEQARTQLLELNALLEERSRWTRDMDRQLSEKGAYILQLQADYDAKVQWGLSLQADLEQARGMLQALQADYDNKVQWALSLQQDLEQARGVFQALQTDYDNKVQWALSLQQDLEQAREALERLQQEFEERTAWALRLDAELKERNVELKERNADLLVLYSSLWYRIGKKLRLSPAPPSDQP